MAYIGDQSSRREALLGDHGVPVVTPFGYQKSPWPIDVMYLDWTNSCDLESYSCHFRVESYVEQKWEHPYCEDP